MFSVVCKLLKLQSDSGILNIGQGAGNLTHEHDPDTSEMHEVLVVCPLFYLIARTDPDFSFILIILPSANTDCPANTRKSAYMMSKFVN